MMSVESTQLANTAALLEQQRFFDALFQLGPWLDDVRAGRAVATPDEEITALSAMLQCLYTLNMAAVADAYAVRLTTLLHESGDTVKALETFNTAFAQHPQGALLYLHAGELMRKLERLPDAVRCFEQALQFDPWNAVVHNNLGNVCKQLGRLPEAAQAFRKALQIRPDFLEFKNNLAVVLQELGQFEDSLVLLREMLAERADYKSAWLNCGSAQMQLLRYQEAEHSYQRALAIDPDYIEARFNLGMCQLTQGKALDGYHHYEARYLRTTPLAVITAPPVAIPRWQEQDLRGKTLLVMPEQGLGDQIMCAAYIATLREGAGLSSIVVVCETPLRSLLSRIKGIDVLHTRQDAIPVCDYWTGFMSLPHHVYRLGLTLPPPAAYLTSDAGFLAPSLTQHLCELRAQGAKTAGLCWKGSASYAADHLRSFALDTFTPLLSLPALRLVTLLPGTRQEFLLWAGERAIDAGHEIDSQTPAFEETAALISALDIVITSDTSIAHLAIALGKPTWLLLTYAGEWRWHVHPLADHPLLKIFRQPAPGDWSAVVTELVNKLPQQVLLQVPNT